MYCIALYCIVLHCIALHWYIYWYRACTNMRKYLVSIYVCVSVSVVCLYVCMTVCYVSTLRNEYNEYNRCGEEKSSVMVWGPLRGFPARGIQARESQAEYVDTLQYMPTQYIYTDPTYHYMYIQQPSYLYILLRNLQYLTTYVAITTYYLLCTICLLEPQLRRDCEGDGSGRYQGGR